MLIIFFTNSVFFIRVKDWSEDTFSNAVLEIGQHIGLKFRVCLNDRLGTWTAKADYFFLILTQANAPYACPGPGPQCPSAGLKLPTQSKQIQGLAHALSRLNFSSLCLRHTSTLYSSSGSALSSAHPSHGWPPSSLLLEFPVSVLPSPLPVFLCNSSQQHLPSV